MVWTLSRDSTPLGAPALRVCEQCGGEELSQDYLLYSFISIYGLFPFVKSKTLVRVCSKCETEHDLGSEAVPRGATEEIPFFRRFGCVLLVGFLLVFAGISFVINNP